MTMTVGQRILLGFAIIIALTGTLGWYSLDRIEAMADISSTVAAHDAEIVDDLLRIAERQNDMHLAHDRTLSLYLLGKLDQSAESPSAAIQEWRENSAQTHAMLKELEAAAARYEAVVISEQRQLLWRQLKTNVGDTIGILENIGTVVEQNFSAMQRDDLDAVTGRFNSLDALRNEFRDQVVNGQIIVQQLLKEGRAAAVTVHASARISIIVAVALVTGLALLTVFVLQRSIVRPLSAFMSFIEPVGRGDLTLRTDRTGGDEFGQLGLTLNGMVESLAEVAGHMRGAVERLSSAAAEIQAESQQQASSTSEQSAAIQQITTTMEEIAQTGGQISERANEVAAGAEAASASSRSGLEAAEETGRAMDSIRDQAEMVAQNIVALTESAQSVGDIITTVNDIAERSNLLAFNASLEAAAAGEHGETFAVVAGEIKHLADQAKQATGQVKGLLGDMQQGISKAVMLTEEAVKRTETGKQSSDSTLATIRELASNVETSVQTFQQIVAGTNQQQIGIEQVTGSVQSIREASEQMTAGTRQLEQAANSLTALGDQLRATVDRYRV